MLNLSLLCYLHINILGSIYLRAIVYIIIEAVGLAKITQGGNRMRKVLRTEPQGTPVFMRWAENEIPRKDS